MFYGKAMNICLLLPWISSQVQGCKSIAIPDINCGIFLEHLKINTK